MENRPVQYLPQINLKPLPIQARLILFPKPRHRIALTGLVLELAQENNR